MQSIRFFPKTFKRGVMTIPFKYQQLNSSCREIRLLELLPKSQWLEGLKPACRIFHSSLDHNPRFCALSYVWGDQTNQRDIHINGCTLKVTKNLLEALMHIVSSEAVTIWIDAICINQKDKKEKGEQVALMGDIYRNASEVLAWLGPAASNSNRVIDHLNKFGRMVQACGVQHPGGLCVDVWRAMIENPEYVFDQPLKGDPNEFFFKGMRLPASTLALENLLYTMIDSISGQYTPPTIDLRRLYQREWWGRIWVLQEITLPKKVQFLCGRKRIPYQVFLAAHNAYSNLFTAHTQARQRSRMIEERKMGRLWMDSRRADKIFSLSSQCQTQGLSLAALLQETNSRPLRSVWVHQHHPPPLKTTISQDRIFGVLGLANDCEDLKSLGVLPSYTKPKRDICAGTMAALLSRGHMSLLSYCPSSGNPGCLPSWAVDWSRPLRKPLQRFGYDHTTLFPPLNACGSRNVSQIIAPDKELRPRTISMMAKIYDEVLEPGHVKRWWGNAALWTCKLLSLTYLSERRYSSFRERFEAVSKTSHTRIGYGEGYTQLAERVDHYLDSLCLVKSDHHLHLEKHISNELQELIESYEMIQDYDTRVGRSNIVFRDIGFVSQRRSPFITQKGHLGVASWHIKKGDTIALISGAQIPFLLRKQENGQYIIISEAYVDGIMDGEAAENGEWKYIDII